MSTLQFRLEATVNDWLALRGGRKGTLAALFCPQFFRSRTLSPLPFRPLCELANGQRALCARISTSGNAGKVLLAPARACSNGR